MLFEHVGVQEVLVNLFVALHEEYVAYTGKVRIHKAMVALFPSTVATITVHAYRDVLLQRYPFDTPLSAHVTGTFCTGRGTYLYVDTGYLLLVSNAVLHNLCTHQV